MVQTPHLISPALLSGVPARIPVTGNKGNWDLVPVNLTLPLPQCEMIATLTGESPPGNSNNSKRSVVRGCAGEAASEAMLPALATAAMIVWIQLNVP